MMIICTEYLVFYWLPPVWLNQVRTTEAALYLRSKISACGTSHLQKASGFPITRVQVRDFSHGRCSRNLNEQLSLASCSVEKKMTKKPGKREHHLWRRRDSAGSGQKALNLVQIVSELPNEKEVVYGALDKWTAWELEFPLIAAAKALIIFKKRSQWVRVIQVAKWMLSKGQGATMATYDALLLAFDKERRIDEAGSLWNMILSTHTRSVSRRLFSRMISLYDHHDMREKIIEVFADMEELGVRPDQDTVRRIAHAFQKLGQEDKKQQVRERYGCKWKYIHFEGERVRVRSNPSDDEQKLVR
ncbi:hypothetical protein Nepgr_007027 [Nepenthes gracilis]|uniref:Pentatricopeptide repeat-containing protein n=1 Tax=Nepenthes gracilis TaxID=150966 RepID=A0AAD3XHW2_NEPGR|nr:hypothetical protein Nepgr_007027 [Nepenthes gracilis]